jgi:hypothetical protein
LDEPGEDMTSFNNQNIRAGAVANTDNNAVVVVIAAQHALLVGAAFIKKLARSKK